MARGRRGQSTGPGVQDAHQAGLAAAGCGVQGEGLAGSSGGLAEQVVPALLVRAGARAPCRGEGKGDAARGHGQEQRPWLCQPVRRLVVLARGPGTLRASMRAVRPLTTLGALGDLAAQGCGAAWCNVLHGCEVACGPMVAEAGTRGGTMEPDDVGQGDPARPRGRLRGRSGEP